MRSKQIVKKKALVFSIHAGYVVGMYVSILPDDIHIHRTEKCIFTPSQNNHGLRVPMSKALENMIKKISQGMAVTPDRVFCILHAPWSAFETYRNSREEKKKFKISPEIIGELAEETKKRLVSMAKIKMNIKSVVPIDEYRFSLFSGDVQLSRRDFNKNTKQLSIELSSALADSSLLEMIRNTITKHLLLPTHFIAPYNSLARRFSAEFERHDAVIIRPGEIISNVFLIRNGRPVTCASMPYGLQKIATNVSDISGIILTAPDSQGLVEKFLMQGNYLQEEKLQDMIHASLQKWLIVLQNIFTEMADHKLLPADIYLDSTPLITRTLLNSLQGIDMQYFIQDFMVPKLHAMSGSSRFSELYKVGQDIQLSYADQAAIVELSKRYETI